jgi:hypothetical protein
MYIKQAAVKVYHDDTEILGQSIFVFICLFIYL